MFQGNVQLGVTKHLNTPHYQIRIEKIKIIYSESNFKLKCKLICIGTSGNIDDENMYIETANIEEDKLPIKETIRALHTLVQSKKDCSKK